MSWRKWFVRSLVFSIVCVCGLGAWLYQNWTNPAAVRQQVIVRLETYFPGATVTLDSARMRLLGGINLGELRLARRDDPDKSAFAHVPSAVVYLDKEKLLDGSMGIRKVELDRVHLHLVRDAEGHWNLDGVTGAVQPNVPLPTLVVHEGTLVLEDHLKAKGMPALEINHVSLTMLNDPVATVVIDGRAKSDSLGELEIHGTWNRQSKELVFSMQVQGAPVTAALLQRLAPSCPTGDFDHMLLDGSADIKADLAWTPGSSSPFSYDVHARLAHAKLRHPRIPLPLEDLDADLRCTNGTMEIKNLKARSGLSLIWAQGVAYLPCPEANFHGTLEVQHLELCEKLFQKLPAFEAMVKAFSPTGLATIRIACSRQGGIWTALPSREPSTVSLIPENMKARFHKFPYPLEFAAPANDMHRAGSLDMNLLTGAINVDIVGHSGSQPVLIKGTWQGKGKDVDARFDISANDLPLDDKLLDALHGPPEGPAQPYEALARSFHAHGKGDIKAFIRHAPGNEHFDNEYHVRFHDADCCWDQFPYLLTEVSGILDIYPQYWEFHDFHGRHEGGQISVQGKTTTPDNGDRSKVRLLMDLSGRAIPLDTQLRAAFGPLPSLSKVWDTFVPSRQADFVARIDRPLPPPGPKAEEQILRDMDVQVRVRGGTIEPRFFPYALAGVAGRFHYHHNRVDVTDVSARHGATQVSLKSAAVELYPQGAHKTVVKELRARDLRPDDDFIRALPESLKKTCASLELKDPVLVQTDMIVSQTADPSDPPSLYWDGQLWVHKAKFRVGLELSEVDGTLACRGNHWRDPRRGELLAMTGGFQLATASLLKQPFHDVQGHFLINDDKPEVLAIGLKAPLFGGDISGQIGLKLNSSLPYDLNLTASQIDLEQFGRHNLGPRNQLKGTVLGRLYLSGLGSGIDTLDGNGRIDVPHGHIGNLPLLLDLLKFLGLRWPDRTMFDETHASFNVHGPVVHIERLELLGNAVSLYGKGDFKIDGTDLKLDFYPSWGRLEQLAGPAKPIPAEISKQLLKIEMRGQVSANPGDLKFTKKPVPFLVDPLLYLRDKMSGSK